MRRLTQLQNAFRWLFQRQQVERDLEDELRDHLEQETQSNIRAGMTPEEARFAAQRLIGPANLFKEECRDARAFGFIETTIRDVRYACRMLVRTPLFTAVALVTLAIGIGANTAVFTFVDNILLRPLQIHAPEQVAVLNWTGTNFSYPNYLDFRDRNSVFSSLTAYRYVPANISDPQNGNFRAWGYETTGNYFDMLGVRPKLGRFFGPQVDGKTGANPVVVISYKLWKARFAGDPGVVGKTLKINRFPFTIIGVTGDSFTGTELVIDGEFWVPMSMVDEIESGNNWIQSRVSTNAWVSGRLKPGTSWSAAEANLNRICAQIMQEHPSEVSTKAKLHLSKPGLVGDGLRQPLNGFGAVLMAISGLGLLLACVNLAGMLLARASDRRREVGIRLAIGASRGQLLRQLMTESFLLASAGGVAGYALAYAACAFLSSWHPTFDIPVNIGLQPNLRVLGFTLAAAVLTTLICGLAPALQSVRVDLVPSLKNEPQSVRFQRWSMRDLLVTGQIALSVMLVVCSVLVVRSLQHALSLPLGFNPEHAVSISFDLGLKGYDSEHIRSFQRSLLEKASAIPGIEAAGITSTLPLSSEGEDNEFIWHANQPQPPPAEQKLAMVYNISPGYLRAAGTRLLAGRDIDSRDQHESQPVALVNETLGHLFFGNESPVGKALRLSGGVIQIVGVVEDGKYDSLGEDATPAIFVPIRQQENRWTTLLARTNLPSGEVAESLSNLVKRMDSEITVFNAGSFKDHLALPLFPARMAAIVLGTFGVFAMVLAAIGLFALMSYAVSRRTREIGIRIALGARRSQVLSSLLLRTLVLCAVGVTAGTFMTLAAGGMLSAVLYGISPRDPLSYALVLLLMTAVAALACWTPATRAVRIDPMRALRED